MQLEKAVTNPVGHFLSYQSYTLNQSETALVGNLALVTVYNHSGFSHLLPSPTLRLIQV